MEVGGGPIAIDGDTIAVGTPKDGGTVYIFTRTEETWHEQAKLQAINRQNHDEFGKSVAIDGDTVVIGDSGDDTGCGNAGAAYIFTRTGETWRQQVKLQASDRYPGDRFGNSVAIEGDTIVVGAHGRNKGKASVGGAAYILSLIHI